MAIFVFQMKTFTRGAGSRGSRATSAAAYRAGERIRDERTGATYDHRRREDVLHREIVLPEALGASPPAWTQDRASLWNAAEAAESRSNARVAREYMVALPHELGAADRLRLARGMAREISERHGNAIDLVLHAPRNDPRNYHAHMLASTREVQSGGFGHKTTFELSGRERHRRGLLRWSEERQWLRERWADLTNGALKEAGLDMRVSAEYPMQRERALRMPAVAYHIEQRGGHSYVAEHLRAAHAARVEAAHTARVAQVPDRASAINLEQLRQSSVDRWLAMRSQSAYPEQLPQESLRRWLEQRRQAALPSAAAAAPDRQKENQPMRRQELSSSADQDLGL